MKKITLISLVAVFALFLGACSSSVPGVAISLPNINGTQFNSGKDAKNSPMFVAFMATYCGYCKMSIPQVIKLQDNYASKGLKVMGIYSDTTPDKISQYAKQNNVNYNLLYDQNGAVSSEFQVNGVPHFVLLNKNHDIVKVWVGYNPNHNFDEEIKKVL